MQTVARARDNAGGGGARSRLLTFCRFALPPSLVCDWSLARRALSSPALEEGGLEAALGLAELRPLSLAVKVIPHLLGRLALRSAGRAEEAAGWRSGGRRCSVARRELGEGGGGGETRTRVAREKSGGWTVSGKKVVFGAAGDECVVVAETEGGEACVVLVSTELAGVTFGGLGEGELFGWVRFEEVKVPRQAVLCTGAKATEIAVEVGRWESRIATRFAAAGLGMGARMTTRFVLEREKLAVTAGAQRALSEAHAALFAADLLKAQPHDFEGAVARFVSRLSARGLETLAETVGISGALPVNLLPGLLAECNALRALAGSMRPLTEWICGQFETRYGGVAGLLEWAKKRLGLMLHRVNPLASTHPTWLRSYEFQSGALKFRLLSLTAKLMEKPKSHWRTTCSELVDAVGTVFLQMTVLKRFIHLEDDLEDERAAQMVARCRSLFLFANWDEAFFLREGYISASQARAIEVERAVLAVESFCDVETLCLTSRDPALDVLNNSPMGAPRYLERVYEWTRSAKL